MHWFPASADWWRAGDFVWIHILYLAKIFLFVQRKFNLYKWNLILIEIESTNSLNDFLLSHEDKKYNVQFYFHSPKDGSDCCYFSPH